MTTIGITGIGGFIGLRMATRAHQLGWTVRGFDLDPDGVERAQKLGADAVVGDVEDTDFLRTFFDDVDIVFHTAAIVDEAGDEDLFYRVNVEGTKNVADAARNKSVEQFVHLSSVMVYGFDYPQDVDESWEPEELQNIYCATKRQSDEAVRAFDDPDGMGVIVIRPGDVYGSGSRPWLLRPLEMIKSGLFNLPGKGQGLINHVHVDNLLDAVFLALEQDATGEVFNVTDDVATPCKEFFSYHAHMAGKDSVPTMPTFLLKSFLTLIAPPCRLLNIEPPATPEAMDFLLRTNKVSTAKARQVLGYEPKISLTEGMEAIADRKAQQQQHLHRKGRKKR